MPSWTIGCSLSGNMDIILNGILYGIGLSFLIGPVFFALIQTSMERGFRNGFFMAIGICISDTLYLLLAYLGLAQFASNPMYSSIMSYAGGFVLLGFGLYYVLVKSRKVRLLQSEALPYRSPLRIMAKGFLLNGLSPMVLFFWMATVGVASSFGYHKVSEAGIFFVSILLTILITDMIKALLAHNLSTLINIKSLQIINIVLGILLILFAIRLLTHPEMIGHQTGV